MLPAAHRLVKDGDIKKVLANGRSFFSPAFRVRLRPNRLSVSRFAIVVSTKVSKRATKRNTVRRRTRELIRRNLEHLKPGYDLVISLSPKALDQNYQALEEEFLANLKKLKLWL